MVVVILLVVVGAIWWILSHPSTPASIGPGTAGSQTSTSVGLGGQVFDQIQSAGTTELPKTNPFDAQTNPYKGAYTNPFGQ